jgi:hypothetical protein
MVGALNLWPSASQPRRRSATPPAVNANRDECSLSFQIIVMGAAMRTNRAKRADHPPLSPHMKTKSRIICPYLGKMSLPRLVAKLKCFLAETGAAGKADKFARRRSHPPFVERCENQNDRQGYGQRDQQNDKPLRDFQTKPAFLFHMRRLPSNVVAKIIIAIDNPSLSPNVGPPSPWAKWGSDSGRGR